MNISAAAALVISNIWLCAAVMGNPLWPWMRGISCLVGIIWLVVAMRLAS